MTNEIMIPDAGEVPAYIRNASAAKAANEDAAFGISTGAPPRVKISGKQFKLVDGNGEEKSYPPAQMVAGPNENTYMRVIILRAKKDLRKTWYASKYMVGDEPAAPDCFSEDGKMPDKSITTPQSDSCETCACNAWGSGTDQDGNATAGKACSDTKILGVYVVNHGVHALKVPPSSLKNFGLFIKKLNDNSIPVGSIYTLVGFDVNCDFPKLEFQFGGWLDEKLLPKVDALSKSDVVTDIVGGKKSPALPDNSAAEAAAKKKAAEEAAAKKKAAEEAAAKKKAEAEAAAKKKAGAQASDELGLGLGGLDDDLGLGAEQPEEASSGPSDAELMDELGL